MKLDKAVFSFIEHELYNYDDTKKQIEQIRDSIINGTPAPSEPVQSQMGNTTESKAIRLTSNIALIKMVETVQAIEKALSLLGEDHNQIFELKYRQALDWKQVVINMPTSQDTYFRKRRELVRMVAQRLGHINP